MKRLASGLAAAAVVAAALTLAASSCRHDDVAPRPQVRFEPVPPSSGFSFRHELPGGTLDNLPKSAMGGVALLDFDQDGRIDVYCVNGGWHDRLAGPVARPREVAKARLYRNLGGMRFEDVTERARVGFEGFGLGACVGDVNADGFPDLFVSAYGQPALYRSRGDGTYDEVSAAAGIAPGFYAGATFLDFDRDGVLDLFASQYVDPAETDPAENRPGQFPGPTEYRGQSARLYRGHAGGTFEDVTVAARVGSPGRGMGVLATDVDGDGWIDVFVANDAQENFLWRNQRDRTFADAAVRFGLAFGGDGEPRSSMGITAADLDANGRLDYLVPDTRGGCAYVSRDSWFTDRALDWGLVAATHRMIGWSDVALDGDDDGRVDVWKVQGDLRSDAPTALQLTYFVENRGPMPQGGIEFAYEPPAPAATATLQQIEAAFLARAQVHVTGRGGVAADFDDDGREDLLCISLNARAWMFRNVTQGGGRSLRVRLVGKPGNTMALGARLTGRAGSLPVVREVSSSTAYLCAPDPRIHVGLGTAESLDDVVVRWSSGREQKVGSLAAGRQDHVITEE